jgi:hypothetical protein
MKRIAALVAVLALSAPAAAQARTGLSRVQAAGDTTRLMSFTAGNINDTVQNYDGWSAIPTYPRECWRANRYLVYCNGHTSGTVYDPSVDLSQDFQCDYELRWYKFRDGLRQWRQIGNAYCWSISNYYANDGRSRGHANVPPSSVERAVARALP